MVRTAGEDRQEFWEEYTPPCWSEGCKRNTAGYYITTGYADSGERGVCKECKKTAVLVCSLAEEMHVFL